MNQNVFSLTRTLLRLRVATPSLMQVCQGIRIISMTRLGNIGAILCLISSTKFLDSGETEMREEFRCSQAVTYESVEAQLEEGEGELVTHFEEKRTQESHTLMDLQTVK